MKRIIVKSIAILSLMSMAGLGGYKLLQMRSRIATDDAQVERAIMPVLARVGGFVKEVRFTEHQRVRKGDTLLVFDDRELRIQLQLAEAAYLDAQANRRVLGNSINTVRNNVTVVNATVLEAQMRMENAKNNFERYASLIKDGAVTKQQYEAAQTEFEVAKARYEAASHQRGTAELSASETDSRKAVSEAGILRAGASLDMARINLSYAVVVAPADGIVGRRTIQPGQMLQPGQAIVSLVRTDDVWITANFLETQGAHFKVGQPALIRVDAYPGKVLPGRIGAVSEATGARYSLIPTDNSTGNFIKVQQRLPVRIDFDSSLDSAERASLRAGMSAEVEIGN